MPRNPIRPREALSGVWVPAVLAIALAALSWCSEDLAGNDLERIATSARWGAICALLALWSGAYVGREHRTRVRPLAVGVPVAAMLACFPVGSKDAFLYAFYGKMWAELGRSPLVHAPSSVSGDPWLRFLDAWWKDSTAAYGPLFMEQTWLVHRLVGARLWAVVLAYKLCGAAAVVLAARWIRELAGTGEGKGGAKAWGWAWLACPLVLFEAVGNGHNDAVMAAMLVAAVAAFVRGRTFAAGSLLGAAFWYKWYALLCVPVLVARTLGRWHGRALATHIARLTAGALVISAPVLVPVAGRLPRLIDRAMTFENVRVLFPTELPPPLWLLFQGGRLGGLLGTPEGLEAFHVVRFGLLAVGLACVCAARWRAPFRADVLAADLLWSLGLFFGLAVTMLWPWHLLPLCALALCSGRPWGARACNVLTVVGLLSYAMTFSFSALAVGLSWGALKLLRGRSGDPRRAGP